MTDHRSSMDYLLDIDDRHDEMRLTLAKALTALHTLELLMMSRPVNQRSAEQIRAARREITAQLRMAA